MNDFTQARTYLTRVVPWASATGVDAFVNLHWKFQGQGFDRSVFRGKPCRTVDEAIRALSWTIKQPGVKDIYVCMSSQREAETRTTAEGKTFLTAVRAIEFAVGLKALFIDVDVKEGGYADTKEAVAALGEFLKASGMPKPTMFVATGSGGLHVYWVMAEVLAPHEWKPLAEALVEATRRHGFKCDTQCTIDAARILRLPDTFNHKHSPPKPARIAGTPLDFDYSVERLQTALEPYMVKLTEQPLPPKQPIKEEDELSAGIGSGSALPVHLDDVAKGCPFIDEAITTGGKAFQQPLWNLTTLLATFTDDPRPDAHRMACGHQNYAVEDTDALFDRKEREKARKNFGWTSCASIAAAGAKGCQTCPKLKDGKTPFHGAPDASTPFPNAPPSSQADMPAGYVRGADGIIRRMVTTDDGATTMVPICPYPIEDAWLDPRNGEWTLHFTTRQSTGREEKVTLPCNLFSAKEGLPKALANQSIFLHEHETKAVREFFVAFSKQLQSIKTAVVKSAPFGWADDHGRIEGFSYGGRVVAPTGERPSASADPVLSRQYTPSGNLQPWITAARLITDQGRPDLNAILAASFGAPLVRFTGQSGMLMSAYSTESGIGKSTALKVAQAVWGHPIRAMQSLDDTYNSVMHKIGEIKSLPMFWDELKTEEDTKKFVNMTFSIAQGREKSRLTQAASQRQSGDWQTLLVVASNDSLMDQITRETKTTTAGLYRVFEYTVTPGSNGQIANGIASRLIGQLNHNYGYAGTAYSEFLGQNSTQIDREVGDMLVALEVETQSRPDERFWVSLIACVLMGARYSNFLQLTQIDEDQLKAFMLATLSDMRAQRNSQPVDFNTAINISEVLGGFLNDMRARHTIRTNRIWIQQGKPAGIKVLNDDTRLDTIYVQVGVEDGLIRFTRARLYEWLKHRGYARTPITKALDKEFGVKVVHGCMASGTIHASMTQYLLEIDVNGTTIKDYFEG
jgi:hypothetical protein